MVFRADEKRTKLGVRMVDPLQFLEDARPFRGESRFILGTFERGVTLYRQQVRALNLVYAMVEAKDSEGVPVIPPGCRIAVIGGGAFGMTIAAAAAYAGFRVVLLERQQSLLDLQRGCNTRWVHPRFYDWPAPESERRQAQLPLLDWGASTAAQVATEIERQFRELMSEKPEALKCVLEVSTIAVSKPHDGIHEVRYRSRSGQQNIWSCSAVIYAVGFGIEKGGSVSYWRDDRLGQSDLDFGGGARIRYVVSGVGDGGLVDVFRLTIRDFRHDQIFSEMFGPPGSPALTAIGALRADEALKGGWIFDQFQRLESGDHAGVLVDAMGKLKARLRSDTAVTLNGTESSFRRSLTLGRVSLSNALLIYCLFRIDAVTYEIGELDIKNPKRIRIKTVRHQKDVPPWLKGTKVIIRHGTDREDALRKIGCAKAIAFLKKQKAIRDSGQPIYQAGWWGRYTSPEDASNPGRAPAPVEFVPPALMSHAATFVVTLGNILGVLIDRKSKDRSREPRFRVTLHRFVRFDGHEVYQQLTPYAGRVDSKAGVGRYFRVESGIVGLAGRSGSLVVIRKADNEGFKKVWSLTPLDRSGAKEIKPYVNSLVACPFFSPRHSVDHVPLVLFADSVEPDFFDSEVLEIISAACRGFVGLLEDLYKRGALRSLPSYYPGVKVENTPQLVELVMELKKLGVQFTDAKEQGWKEGLTFKTLKSLDLEVGPFMKLGQ